MTKAEKCGLSVCLVGCGNMGRLHGEAILRHSKLSSLSLCDIDPSPARKLAGRTRSRMAAAGGSVVFKHVRCIFCCNATGGTCGTIGKDRPEWGLCVLRETPGGRHGIHRRRHARHWDLSADRIQVGFNRRFDPHMAELKRRVLAGDIGEIEQLQIVSRDHVAPSVESLEQVGGAVFRNSNPRFRPGTLVAR